MKVNGDQTAVQLDAYLKKVQASRAKAYENPNKSSAISNIDQVELSGKAKAMQQAAQALNQKEAGIAERVQQVKMEIEKGTYKVEGTKVATDMLKESFENNQVFNKIDMHV